MSIRSHSLSRAGIEDAGMRAGSENAWIDAKLLDAYGKWVESLGMANGRTLG